MVERINMAIKEISKVTAHLIAMTIKNNANKINKQNIVEMKYVVMMK